MHKRDWNGPAVGTSPCENAIGKKTKLQKPGLDKIELSKCSKARSIHEEKKKEKN
jgi:hypothetical protein